MKKLKEIFKNIDWCKFGIHNYDIYYSASLTGWAVQDKYCKRCGKHIRNLF